MAGWLDTLLGYGVPIAVSSGLGYLEGAQKRQHEDEVQQREDAHWDKQYALTQAQEERAARQAKLTEQLTSRQIEDAGFAPLWARVENGSISPAELTQDLLERAQKQGHLGPTASLDTLKTMAYNAAVAAAREQAGKAHLPWRTAEQQLLSRGFGKSVPQPHSVAETAFDGSKLPANMIGSAELVTDPKTGKGVVKYATPGPRSIPELVNATLPVVVNGNTVYYDPQTAQELQTKQKNEDERRQHAADMLEASRSRNAALAEANMARIGEALARGEARHQEMMRELAGKGEDRLIKLLTIAQARIDMETRALGKLQDGLTTLQKAPIVSPAAIDAYTDPSTGSIAVQTGRVSAAQTGYDKILRGSKTAAAIDTALAARPGAVGAPGDAAARLRAGGGAPGAVAPGGGAPGAAAPGGTAPARTVPARTVPARTAPGAAAPPVRLGYGPGWYQLPDGRRRAQLTPASIQALRVLRGGTITHNRLNPYEAAALGIR